jgi:phosphomannomutase/phosphoglucomutase
MEMSSSLIRGGRGPHPKRLPCIGSGVTDARTTTPPRDRGVRNPFDPTGRTLDRMEVFGSSGVRGVVGDLMTPAFVGRVARAAGAVFRDEHEGPGRSVAALARDTRRTGETLADAAAAGLTGVGLDVHRLGVVPTPGLQAYAEAEGVPGLMVTASHNPPEYNGIKLVGADGVELDRAALERVEAHVLAAGSDDAEGPAYAAWDETGRTQQVEASRRRYVEGVLGAVDRAAIADADLTVALDPGHGAGALTSPDLFRELGCEVVTVNATPDGHFPGRNPEPVPEHLGDLGRLVRATDADVGIAHDGDADRAIFYDGAGDPIEGDATLAALAAADLRPGDATVSAVNVSQRLVEAARRADADLELTPIGSTHIITRIQELQAGGTRVPVAGEGNGGVLFPPYRLTRDGAYTAARFCELLAGVGDIEGVPDGRRSVREVVAPFAGYENVRLNIGHASDAEREAMVEAIEAHADAADADLTTIDGYRLDFGDSWVLARESGTEPLVRVYAEAPSRERAESLAYAMRDDVLAATADF